MTRQYLVRSNHVEFGRTLEFDSLPTLGANPHAGRGQSWRRILIALAGFWLVVAAAVGMLMA
jgi:hypothetical protein